MRFSTSSVLLGSASLVSAFPAGIIESIAQDPELAARTNELYGKLKGRQHTPDASGATAIFEPVPIFEESQLIDVSDDGPNPFVAPGPNDLRGPCPGLNAFANHGFLPHNGYATITQFIDATNTVVGMGPTLAGFLAVLGASIDGDGTAWSIGGTPGAGIGGPLASQGNGISGSHNKYESDASPTRPDLYQAGNDYKTQAVQFNELIAMSPKGYVDLNSLTNFRSFRFDHQVKTNPYFFNGPFTGVLVQPAAYTFIYRFMANHSAAEPYGYLDYSTLASWFSMKKVNGVYVSQPRMERIPYNWYKRAEAYPYDNEYFLADAANALALHPKFANVGGNVGKPNKFVGVNVEDLSGGVFNGKQLLQGNNFACLAYQFAAQVKPDFALASLTSLLGKIGTLVTDLDCPQLNKIDNSQLMQFPGYKRSGVSPT